MRFSFLAPLALASIFAACANAPATNRAAAVAPPMLTGQSGEALRKGMTGDEVRRIMGTPIEIQPFPAPSGAAEVWLYRRKSVGPTRQLQVGVQAVNQQVLGSDGAGHTRTLDQVPIYRQMHIETSETIRLLMFEGRFVESKVTASPEQVFE